MSKDIYIIENTDKDQLLREINNIISSKKGALMGGVNNYSTGTKIKYSYLTNHIDDLTPDIVFYATIRRLGVM